ncbi:MAG: nucleotidyltransferase domain-containing protein [Candidatus Aenigmarchaeota archaeon]|nr:nucleotidyltransferase domain-containing protein [Candidatus Aenigmarchaeota archaeon]
MRARTLTVLQQEVLRHLFLHAGQAFNARGLALAVGVSHPGIAKALPALERRGLVRVAKDKASKRLSIELNRENPLVIGLKRADNVRLLYESGLAAHLVEQFPGCAVIVFGSFAKGEDTLTSDVDVAVVGHRGKALDLRRFEKVLMKEIRVNAYPSFRGMERELLGNILGGILLSGWIEL